MVQLGSQTWAWRYAPSGDWSSLSSWRDPVFGGAVPGPTDVASISGSTGPQLNVTIQGAAAAWELNIGDAAVNLTGSLTIGAAGAINGSASNGLQLTGVDASIYGSGTLLVDAGIALTGTTSIGTSGSITVNGSVYVGGLCSLSSNGGTIAIQNNLVLGYVSSTFGANLSLTNGATLSVGGNIDLSAANGTAGPSISLQGGTITAGGVANGGNNDTATVNGYGQINAPVSGPLQVNAQGGTLVLNGTFGGGIASIASGATLELGGASSAAVTFGGGNAVLKLDAPASFTGTIANMSLSDTIDLGGISVSGASYNASTSTLTVTQTNGQPLSFHVSGTFSGDAVNFATDGNGGTDIYWALPKPTVAITSTGGVTNTATQTIAGTVTAAPGEAAIGPTVALYDNGTQIGTAPVTNGQWSTTLTLPNQGANAITASDTDAANNTGTSAPVTYTLESVAPPPPVISSPANGSTIGNADPTISGTGEAGDIVTFSLASIGGGKGGGHLVKGPQVAPDGTWSVTFGPLSDGSYSVTATEENAAGTVSAASTADTFTIKTGTTESAISDAAVTIGSDGKNYINAANINGGTTTLSGTAEAGDTVQISDGTNAYTATVASGGSWTANISGLANGQTYTYAATAMDAVGNTAKSQPFSFTVDTASPDIAITSTAGVTNTATQTIAGTVTAAPGEAALGPTVALYDNGTQIGTAPVTNGQWSTTLTLPNQGANAITASDTDAANNTGTSAPVTYTLVTAPTWTGAAGDGNWSTAANWSTGLVPTSSDNVIVNNAPIVDNVGFVNITSAASANSLTLRGGIRILGRR